MRKYLSQTGQEAQLWGVFLINVQCGVAQAIVSGVPQVRCPPGQVVLEHT